MSIHKVKFTLPERELGKADIIFEVKKDGEKLGELRVSHGSAVWFPRSGKQGYKIGWKKLDELFTSYGNKTEKR